MEDKLREAIRLIQLLRDEIRPAPAAEHEEEDWREMLDSEPYGRLMAYENALNILQILAHDWMPAQGESRKV